MPLAAVAGAEAEASPLEEEVVWQEFQMRASFKSLSYAQEGYMPGTREAWHPLRVCSLCSHTALVIY